MIQVDRKKTIRQAQPNLQSNVGDGLRAVHDAHQLQR